jgi:cellulose synthase/poly-beta-1,6-N-acetylglucosamine synthase-like glycosyltransferase
MISLIQIILFWILFDFLYIAYRIFLLILHKRNLKFKKYPLVSVLVPAYNEEICIEKTLSSCIYQTYPNMEIIVINDGSTDKTKIIVDNFKKKHLNYLIRKNINLKIINQKNQGKAKALNKGKKQAKGDFLVTIDADSYLNSHAIEKIIGYFYSKKIGAVAGNIIVISKHNILGYLQKIDYELGVHFIRNSQSSLGNVIITPGAFSAYRTSAIKKFEEGTLTEDFDTSMRILERGYRIIMASDAICYTQVPLSISDLIKQRIRWQQGGLEVFSKHSFHKKRFLVSLEWIFLFLFGFYALFGKILAMFAIPLLTVSNDYFLSLLFIICFFVYSLLIYGILFSIVAHYSHDKRAILAVPLFVIYYYTIVLYSVLVAQILILKGGNRLWEKPKRYRT